MADQGRDGSSVIVTSEPKKNGTASIVATQIGLPTLESNDEARERWMTLLRRFLETVAPPARSTGLDERLERRRNSTRPARGRVSVPGGSRRLRTRSAR
jgi:hypothetical protein